VKPGELWICDSELKFDNSVKHLTEQWNTHHWLMIKYGTGKTRTIKQQAAIEVYCRNIAEKLNEYGIPFDIFFKHGYRVPWSQEIVKENIWRVMQRAVVQKESTKDLERQEVSEIYDHLNIKLADHGIHIPWPVKHEE